VSGSTVWKSSAWRETAFPRAIGSNAGRRHDEVQRRACKCRPQTFSGVFMTKPLAGYRVADFSHVMAGPYATHLLTLLGAEVIKIEPPAGDAVRAYRGDRRFDGMSAAFAAVNAMKKSIALDLKDADDVQIARQVIERSDVLIENFRPGVIGRL